MKIPQIISWCSLYVIIYMFCKYRTEFVETGSALSQIISMLAFVWAVYCFIYVNLCYKLPLFFKMLNVFLLMIVVYGGNYMLFGETYYLIGYGGEVNEVSKRNYMFNVFHSMMPIYAFYYYTKRNKLTEKSMLYIFFILILLTTATYWMNFQRLIVEFVLKGIKVEGFTSNVGYIFLSLFPLLFFVKDKKKLQYLLLVYIVYYIMISMKRGAILIAIISLVYFFYERCKYAAKKERQSIILFTSIVLLVIIGFICSLYLSSDYFQKRLEDTMDGNASNRDMMYPMMIDYFLHKTSPFQFLFGAGADATLKVNGNYAHNDWLEIAINNGCLGLLIYSFLYCSLFVSYFRRCKYLPNHLRNALFVTLLIMAFKTLFSMSYAGLSAGIPLCLGYCLAYDASKNQ